jgi:dTDP-4-amino-4,6-dideoxygalactose transaminase
MLAAQLERSAWIQECREQLWRRYASELSGWAERHQVILPRVPAYCTSSFHMFNVLVPSIAFRDSLFHHLRERGIQAVSHYIPLHLSPMGRAFGGQPGQCPVAERVNELIVRLPFFTNMTAAEQDEVIRAIQAFQPD